jgi:cellulose synthase/poly-beta-1,6-N-acetylglucosamine synthase-like glycosyltransferase
MTCSLPIILLLFCMLLYLSITIIMCFSIRMKQKSNGNQPLISIIIVARNEQDTLPHCLQSLTRLTYPREKMEWVLVNDRSKDRTEKLMQDFEERFDQTQVITIDKLPEQYTGKCYGLIQGVKASTGEILFFTDADCMVPPNWIQSTLGQYDEKTGMVGGFLVLDQKEEKATIFDRIQSLDWINITTVGTAFANLNCPLSVFGNNFSIKRETYEKAGGFESIEKHWIEDYALVRNVRSLTNQTVRIRLDRENLVYTRPVKDLKAFYHQRKRWAIGGRSHNVLGFLLMSTAFLIHLLIPISIVIGEIIHGFLAFLCVLLADTFFLSYPLKKLNRIDLLKCMIPYELYYFGYSIFFAPLFLFARKVQWKSSNT